MIPIWWATSFLTLGAGLLCAKKFENCSRDIYQRMLVNRLLGSLLWPCEQSTNYTISVAGS